VGAHVLDAVLDQHVDGLPGARLGVLVGHLRLAFAPALDALEQRAAHVPGRLAGGECGVQMNMRLDERRHHQVTGGVEVARAGLGRCLLHCDGGDARAVQFDALQAFAATQAGIDDVHRDSLVAVVSGAARHLAGTISPVRHSRGVGGGRQGASGA